jgi:hypothetical protein
MSLFLFLFIIGCGNSQQNSSTENKSDTTNNNTKINKSSDTLKAYASVNGLKMYYEIQGTGKSLIVLHCSSLLLSVG